MIAALLAALSIAGAVPTALTTANRVIWLDSRAAVATACELFQTRWQCDVLPDSAGGIVVMIGEGEIAFQCVAVCDNNAGSRVRQWGRLLVLDPGSVAAGGLQDLRVTAWKPERSAVRPSARRLSKVRDANVDVNRLSDVAFWIAGAAADPEGFISIDGPNVGSTHVAVSALQGGAPETPVFVAVPMSSSLTGRVESTEHQGIADANVALFEPLPAHNGAADAPFDAETTMILRAEARSDSTGAFAFERLAPGPYLVAVIDAAFGRGSVIVQSLGVTAVVRLARPVRVEGRVLRHQLPLPGARVRFTPTPDAFLASADPGELVTEEATTDLRGRFTLSVPRKVAGTLHVIADGASSRLALGSAGDDVNLGDILVSNPHRLIVRLLEPQQCAMSAAGPLGAFGLTIVHGVAVSDMHWFEVPEAGEWAIEAECQGSAYQVQPHIVAVSDKSHAVVDVRIVR